MNDLIAAYKQPNMIICVLQIQLIRSRFHRETLEQKVLRGHQVAWEMM